MSAQEAENIWNLFEPFQGYGFNKAHAACYGRVAYQTAYMKANFPAEYMCAVLTAEAGDTAKIGEIISECKRMGIPVLPPGINSSAKDFTVIKAGANGATQDQICFGLLTIKNLGEGVADAVIAERGAGGPFTDVENFFTRIASKDMNRKSVESLIKCGVLDAFGERNQLLFNVEALMAHARDKQKNASRGQVSLFGELTEAELPPIKLAYAEPASKWDRLLWEKELLGLYLTEHPLSEYQREFALERCLPIKDIATAVNHSTKIAGLVTHTRKILTKTGKPMLFSVLEDLTSKIEVVVFPSVLEKHPTAWEENTILVLEGRVDQKSGEYKFLADSARPIATLA